MYCPTCGTRAEDGAAFCRQCGTNLRGQAPRPGGYPNQPVYNQNQQRPSGQPVYPHNQRPAGQPVYPQAKAPTRQPVFDPSKIPSAQSVHQQAYTPPKTPAGQPVYNPPKATPAQPVYTPPKAPPAQPASKPQPPVRPAGQPTPPVKAPVAPPPAAPVTPAQEQENIPMGILGAFLGALVGGLSIVLLNQLGYVAAVSGILLVIGTIYGYGKLGKKVSPLGVVICLAFVAITPYIATNFTWALAYVEVKGGSVMDAFSNIDRYLTQGVIRRSAYEETMSQTYLYTFLGVVISGFSMLKGLRQEKKNKK